MRKEGKGRQQLGITSKGKMLRQRQTSYDIAYMWKVKKKSTNELIYKTEIESQMQKTNLWLPQGKGRDR